MMYRTSQEKLCVWWAEEGLAIAKTRSKEEELGTEFNIIIIPPSLLHHTLSFVVFLFFRSYSSSFTTNSHIVSFHDPLLWGFFEAIVRYYTYFFIQLLSTLAASPFFLCLILASCMSIRYVDIWCILLVLIRIMCEEIEHTNLMIFYDFTGFCFLTFVDEQTKHGIGRFCNRYDRRHETFFFRRCFDHTQQWRNQIKSNFMDQWRARR